MLNTEANPIEKYGSLFLLMFLIVTPGFAQGILKSGTGSRLSTSICTWKVGEAPKNTIVAIEVTFKQERKLSELKNRLRREKINLNNLRMEAALDVAGERHYYDDKRAIHYGVNVSNNLWFSIKFYPSSEYSQFRCED